MRRAEITVRATVSPTESVEKVEKAIRNVLGDIELKRETKGDTIYIEGQLEGVESLHRLRQLLARYLIRDAARSHLTRRAREHPLVFGLNRQAAYAGRVSFTRWGESPLGPIEVTIKGDLEKVINYLCEKK